MAAAFGGGFCADAGCGSCACNLPRAILSCRFNVPSWFVGFPDGPSYMQGIMHARVMADPSRLPFDARLVHDRAWAILHVAFLR